MSEELRPCPFCGGTKICTEKGINLNYCDNCSAESNVEHWNARPIEDALNARIAELEEERRWIPVGEKPLEAGTFFVLLKNGEVTKDFTFIDGGRYYWWWNRGANITHYMPLPKLPEVQK